jgi:hypothetical protein
MADEQARKDAALQTYRSKLLQHKARAPRRSAPARPVCRLRCQP